MFCVIKYFPWLTYVVQCCLTMSSILSSASFVVQHLSIPGHIDHFPVQSKPPTSTQSAVSGSGVTRQSAGATVQPLSANYDVTDSSSVRSASMKAPTTPPHVESSPPPPPFLLPEHVNQFPRLLGLKPDNR